MFGLKIRSWMENHIVRPRKKGNKNKNGTRYVLSIGAGYVYIFVVENGFVLFAK